MMIVYKCFRIDSANVLRSMYCRFKYFQNVVNYPPVGLFFAFEDLDAAIEFGDVHKDVPGSVAIYKCETTDPIPAPASVRSGHRHFLPQGYADFWDGNKYRIPHDSFDAEYSLIDNNVVLCFSIRILELVKIL